MQKLKIEHTSYITHDVKRFLLEKPKDFIYAPGTAARFSINKPGWEDKKRPFTFTSLNNWPQLELIVKIYEDHNGVTNEMAKLEVGDELIMHEVFDTINYKGKGIFIAGGTGITPFIAIFRALYQSNNIKNHVLLYSNHTQYDIILGGELHQMLGDAFLNVFTKQGVIGFKERRIDRDFLIEHIKDFSVQFYVCGPKDFTEEITNALVGLGATPESVHV